MIDRGGYNVSRGRSRRASTSTRRSPRRGDRRAAPVGEEAAAAVALRRGARRTGELRALAGTGSRLQVPAQDLAGGRTTKGPTGKILRREVQSPEDEG